MRTPIILGLALFAGCADVDSNDLLTSGMYAHLEVEALGDGTSQALATLKAGGVNSNTYVDLTGDDELTAEFEGETVKMTKETVGNYHRYVADFDTDTAGETFTISFTRTVDGGAPQSTLTLPDAFDLDELVDTVNDDEDLVIAWTPSGSDDSMQVELNGDCVLWDAFDVQGDPGTYTVEAGDLTWINDEAPSSCKVDLTVHRFNAGTVDSGFGEGGKAVGKQKRLDDFLYQPAPTQ